MYLAVLHAVVARDESVENDYSLVEVPDEDSLQLGL